MTVASDAPFDDLADVARRGAREWEREMAVGEADAEQLRMRGRSLTDVLWEAMQRGDIVTLILGERELTGRLLGARNDLAVVALSDGVAAVNLSSVDAARLGRGGEGTSGDRTYGSFRAYLGMLEVEGRPVVVLGRGVEVRGTVVAVAPDHLLVRATSDVNWALPLRAVAAVLDAASRPEPI